ncbi:hypothetical protein [Microbispora sp. H10836]|uniref:hypothetical protein n=1 Tax=Microbispora sp. H10836 TaxID=2729106 RepID=UPI0014747BD2|nr:hypothetical protein [Microbispora sp. H10836]
MRADLAAPETPRPALAGAETLFLHDGGAGGHGLEPRAILDVARVAGSSGWCCSPRKAW